MKIIGLQFAGIGPYVEQCSIDFAALSASGMFLIQGETGSGKSTLLDAITMALYDSVSSDFSDSSRMRSKFLAQSRKETFTDLIFEIRDKVYRVRREPQYSIPKLRGEGATEHRASATLWQLDDDIRQLINDVDEQGSAQRYFDFAQIQGNATVLATKANDVGQELSAIIGLTRKQFTTTVLLAQGQFAKLLNMQPEERTQLLADLVDARIFEKVQDELQEARKQAKSELDQDSTVFTQCIIAWQKLVQDYVELMREYNQLADSEQRELENIASDDEQWCLTSEHKLNVPALTAEDVKRALTSHTEAFAQHLNAWQHGIMQDINTAQQLWSQAQKQTLFARQVVHNIEQIHEYSVTVAQQLQQYDDIVELRSQLRRARDAAPIYTSILELKAQQQQHDATVQQHKILVDQIAEFPKREQIVAGQQQVQQARTQLVDYTYQLEQVQHQQELWLQIQQTQEQLKQAQRHVETQVMAVRQAQQQSQDFGTSANFSQQLHKIQEHIEQYGGAQAQLEQAQAVLTHAEQALTLQKQEQQLANSYKQAQQQLEDTTTSLNLAVQTVQQDENAKLAALLIEGQPCPVCGALEHPNPVMRPDYVPDESYIARLEQEQNNARTQCEQLQTKLVTIRADLHAEQEQAHGGVEQAQRELKQANERVEQYQSFIQQRDAVQKQVDHAQQFEQAVVEAQHMADKAQQELAVIQAAHKQLQSRLDSNSTQASLDHRIQELNECIAQAQQHIDQEQALDEQLKRYDAAIQQHNTLTALIDEQNKTLQRLRKSINEACKQANFKDSDAVTQAVLDDDMQVDIEHKIQAFEHACAATDEHGKQLAIQLYVTIERTAEETSAIENVDDTENAGISVASLFAFDTQQDNKLSERYTSNIRTIYQYLVEQSVGLTHFDELRSVIAALIQVSEHIDLARFEQKQDQALQQRDDTRQLYTVVHNIEVQSQRLQSQLMQSYEQWAKTYQAYEPIRAMAALANASPDSPAAEKITLMTYSVTERCKDMLEHANELLHDIQGGVYELRLDQSTMHRGRKTGLPISVYDRRSDTIRAAASLSGGETFFVSLALALALADEITAGQGGLSLQTMFIDEGFGSLSDEYLDDVMDVLHAISRHRTIGIISHVDRLKDQVPSNITVTRVKPDGRSTLRVQA